MAFVGFVETTRAARAEHADAPGRQSLSGSARRAHIDVAELIRCNVHPYARYACFTRPATARTARLFEIAEAKEATHDVITCARRGQP